MSYTEAERHRRRWEQDFLTYYKMHHDSEAEAAIWYPDLERRVDGIYMTVAGRDWYCIRNEVSGTSVVRFTQADNVWSPEAFDVSARAMAIAAPSLYQALVDLHSVAMTGDVRQVKQVWDMVCAPALDMARGNKQGVSHHGTETIGNGNSTTADSQNLQAAGVR